MKYFVDYSVIDAKLFLVLLNHCYLMHSKRNEPSLPGSSDKQILGNVSATLQYFHFDQQSEKILQETLVDWSITDAKLLFEVPTQLDMMIDDTVRLMCV